MGIFEISGKIRNTPSAVIAYVADPRHRPLFFPSLKSISDIQGEPTAVGTSWKWTFATLGMEFTGKGSCTSHEPGKSYGFKTEGGIETAFTYRAAADGDGTLLTISMEYKIPESAKSKLPSEERGQKMRQAEAEQVLQNLQTILDR